MILVTDWGGTLERGNKARSLEDIDLLGGYAMSYKENGLQKYMFGSSNTLQEAEKLEERGIEVKFLKAKLGQEQAQVLQSLAKAGLPIYVFTNGPGWQVEDLAKRTGLEHLVRDVVSSTDAKLDKTKAESYVILAKKLKVDVREMIFVTDSQAEADAAKKAGCKAIVYGKDIIHYGQIVSYLQAYEERRAA